MKLKPYFYRLHDGIMPSEKWGRDNLESVDITFDEISKLYEYQLITLEGVLSKVGQPEFFQDNMIICPQCGDHEEKLIRLVDYDNSSEKRIICPECSEYVEDDPGYVYIRDAPNLIQMGEREVNYSVQLLTFEHPDSMTKIMVAYICHKPLNKKHIGKTYKIKGILVFKPDNISIQTDEIHLVEHDEIVDDSSIQDTRDIPGYNEWRKHILSRDKKCLVCGGDKNLHAHHLFGYKENPSLRTHEGNGVAVCEWCHNKYHAYYGMKEIVPVDFINFVRRFGVR